MTITVLDPLSPARVTGTTEFRILGPVGVYHGGREIMLGGAKPLTVLAALLVERGAVVHDDRLISLLWGSDPPRTVGAQLYTYVSRLRKLLPPDIHFSRVGHGYSMSTGNARFDYEDFCRLSDLGSAELSASNYCRAAGYLGEALALWSGPALSNVTEFLSDEQAAGLEERRLATLERRIDADLALGRTEYLLAELHVLAAQYPLRESFRDKLMRALYRCGRQGDAIRVYHEGRRLLADELGVDPDIALQETFRAILAGEPALRLAGGAGAPRRHRSAPANHHPLPVGRR
jgi:DNA-binding SARP family transcriptional activator